MFVEPLLIYPKLECVAYWIHPEVHELIKDMNNQDGHYTGNLIRADLVFDDTRIVHIIFATDQTGMKEILTDEGMPEYLGRLSLLLTQPTWMPGDKVFSETEYGKIFQHLFPMFDEDFSFAVSSDVSLATDGDEWWFDD